MPQFFEQQVDVIPWPITGAPDSEFRLLVSGDRNWTYPKPIERMLQAALDYCSHMDYKLRVIHGAARGADAMAGLTARCCLTEKVEETPVPADWSVYGRAAGPVRNRAMLYNEKPHIVLAFHNNLAASKGTADMVLIALTAKVPVYRIAADCRIWEITLVKANC